MSEAYALAASRAVSPTFYRAPYPTDRGYHLKEYQHAGVEYHLARNHALFGDAPGVGKSAECVALGNAIKAKNTLVICPASLRLNWEREVRMWSTLPRLSTYVIRKASDGMNPDAHYVITSYDMLRNEAIRAAILDYRWDHLILDEAHYLKDPKGNKRTQVVCAPDGLPSVVDRITMASGTILPNQPIECYNAVRLLHWEAIDKATIEDFRNYYYDFGSGFVTKRRWDGNKWVFEQTWSDKVRNQPRNLMDLQRRLRQHVMVRRLKEDVLHELPAKHWHPFPIDPTMEIKNALNHPGWRMAEKLYELDPDAFDNAAPIDGEISTARRLLGEAKAPSIAAFTEDMLESGIEKIVVGAWHLSVLKYLRDRLADYGLVYMDGSTSQNAKQIAVDRFQGDARVRIILGQMLPLGEGWTLTAAQEAILAEPYWVPGKNDQFLDRLHRFGQKGAVTGYMPIVVGTLDERIVSSAIEKDRNIYAALDKVS